MYFNNCLIIAFSIIILNIPHQAVSQNNNELDMNTKLATFGSGCFWCSEAIFNRLEGVINVKPGFAGGRTINPSYEDVVEGTTGHAEVAQITYDPDVVSFSTLLEVFWKTHDPTTLNRQGGDVGTQYRSIIFYHDQDQKKLAEDYLSALESANIWENPIVTEIVSFDKFYPAEDYHNDYYKNNPESSYCSFVITPKIEKFEKVFADKLKK